MRITDNLYYQINNSFELREYNEFHFYESTAYWTEWEIQQILNKNSVNTARVAKAFVFSLHLKKKTYR